LFSCLDFPTAVRTLSMYTSLIGRHWANPTNYDYPLLVPIKKTAALLMNWIGPAITKALTPPPPIEIRAATAKRRRHATAAGRNGGTAAARTIR